MGKRRHGRRDITIRYADGSARVVRSDHFRRKPKHRRLSKLKVGYQHPAWSEWIYEGNGWFRRA